MSTEEAGAPPAPEGPPRRADDGFPWSVVVAVLIWPAGLIWGIVDLVRAPVGSPARRRGVTTIAVAGAMAVISVGVAVWQVTSHESEPARPRDKLFFVTADRPPDAVLPVERIRRPVRAKSG